MKVHLVDGTYELFRHYFVPSAKNAAGVEMGAVRGVLASVLQMIEGGATHIGVATDHVVESFCNELYPGYKTSEGVAPELLGQFAILEDALRALGIVVWPMVEYEPDDALASAAARAARDPRVEQVLICTPDKDLAQCVVGKRVVQVDRRQSIVRDAEGSWRSGVCGRSRSRIIWRWSGAARTSFRGCRGGARRPPSAGFRIWRTRRGIGVCGVPRCGGDTAGVDAVRAVGRSDAVSDAGDAAGGGADDRRYRGTAVVGVAAG